VYSGSNFTACSRIVFAEAVIAATMPVAAQVTIVAKLAEKETRIVSVTGVEGTVLLSPHWLQDKLACKVTYSHKYGVEIFPTINCW
jgi:hypothetical protein